jgi:eukaryotic-like serine/threonine-protein kinase
LNSATTTTRAVSADQERLARILDDYLVAIEQGKSVSPEELLAKYPDDAAQLRGYLSGLQLFHAVAGGAQQESGIAGGSSVPPALQTIGDYRLVREIGRGGMGVVYEAWQVSLRRRVALKVLPFTSGNDAKQIGRFKNEAQAAAQVQHPNIVPVFAVGEENGVHYYVMQLVEGQSLTSLLGAMRGGDEPSGSTTAPNNTLTKSDRRGEVGSRHPHPALSQRERGSNQSSDKSLPMRSNETADHICVVARLGIQAAEALHAAHEYGIVHRDVKPSNLLLDDQGKLWITDFGLARCRENQGLTQTGDVLGTMRYMSPEQALGRKALVDQRTDVYSLGLTMYELATFNHPADEMSDAQLYFDRNRPVIKSLRHWNRHIPGDFETIVLKSMAEFPHERYSSTKELAEDLERFMEGRPILASPPSLVSRVGKWAKRRRGVVYATAAVLLVALFGTATSMMMLSHQKNTANERALLQVRNHLRQYDDMLSLFSAKYADQLDAIPGAEGVRHQMLQDGIEYYQQFEQQAADVPAFATDLALAHSKLGALNEKLGKRAEAFAAHTKAKEAWETRLAREPNNTEYSQNLALCLNNLGLLLADDGRPAEALAMLRCACELQSTAAKADPVSTELATELGTTHGNLGLLLGKTKSKDEAITELRAAIAIQEPLSKSATNDIARRGLAATYNNLASLQESTDPKSAAVAYQKAIGLQVELVKADPINRLYRGDLARTYNNLGSLASRNKAWAKAEACYADAIRLQEELVKAAPLAGSYRRDLAISYNNLGMVQSRHNHFAEAEASFQKTALLQEKLLAAQPNDVQMLSNQGSVWNNLGTLFGREQRYADAAHAFQQAINFQTHAMSGAKTSDLIRGLLSRHYYNYARTLETQAKYQEAVDIAMERKQLWPGNAERLYSVAQELAAMHQQMSSKPEAAKVAAACVEVAAGTLREALAAGLSRDRLKDRSLSGIAASRDFQRLMDDSQVGLVTPAVSGTAN